MGLKEMAEHQKNWNEMYYGYLVGAEITAVSCEIDEYGEAWTKITVLKDGHTFELEISCDEEGNRPGFLFGLPAVVVGEDGELTTLIDKEAR